MRGVLLEDARHMIAFSVCSQDRSSIRSAMLAGKDERSACIPGGLRHARLVTPVLLTIQAPIWAAPAPARARATACQDPAAEARSRHSNAISGHSRGADHSNRSSSGRSPVT